MQYSKLLIGSYLIVGSFGLAMAESAPVVNAYQYENSSTTSGLEVVNANISDAATSPTQGLTVEQRIVQLQQQIANQKRLNIPAQIQQLQQQVQNLTGMVQTQAHELMLLQQKLLQKDQGSIKQASDTTAPASSQQNQQVTTQADTAPNLIASNQTTTPATPTVADANNFLSDQEAYESAYNLIPQKNYHAALAGMQAYLKQYPNGRYASNAHYWSGEIYLIQNNDRMAASEFETVVNKYPQSNKLSDAMLKLGFIYYDNGQLNKSKTQLEQVVKQFPKTTVAKLAQSRLRDIAQQINASQTNQTQTDSNG